MSGLNNVIKVEAGQYHSLALKADGTVWAWGGGEMLGDGTQANRNVPGQVSNLTDVVAISAHQHSLAIKSDGTVWAWGSNTYGALGDGTTTSRLTPVQVIGLTNVVAVATGYYYSVALKSDGTVWTWGFNASGQLGDGTINDLATSRPTPVQVSGLTNVVEIIGGFTYCLARKSDGTVWGWGTNHYGHLTDGTFGNRLTPVQCRLPRVSSIATGDGNNIAIIPTVTVSGALTLEDLVYDAPAQPITFTLRPEYKGPDITRTVNVGASGLFSLADIPQARFTLHIKGANSLATNVALDTFNGSVSNVTAFLRAGDANDDNSVDVLDLDALIQAFDTTPFDTLWNEGADFNCDDSVDVLDLDILLRNFDLVGDA